MNRWTGVLATMTIAVACGGSIDRPEVANGTGHRAARNAIAEANGAEQGCAYTAWSTPINMGAPINSAFNDSHAALTKDELSLYITSTRVSQSAADEDIFVSHRSGLDAPWGTPVRLGPNVNTVGFNDSAPNITPDGHFMYFHSPRPGGCGAADLYVSHRVDTTDDFGWDAAVNLGCVVNSGRAENAPLFFAAGGIDYLYFSSVNPPGGPGGADIMLSTRLTGGDGFGPPVVVKELSSLLGDTRTAIRMSDGLELFVSSNRAGTAGNQDLWVSTRPDLATPWTAPVNMGPTFNTTFDDGAPAVNFDATAMIFYSDRPGGVGMRDLYLSTRSLFCTPTARCHDVSVPADGACQGSASINAGSIDNDDDNDTDCTQSPAGPYALGATQVTLTCTDRASQQTSSCSGIVTVVDTTPPVVTPNPVDAGGFIASLWPPNHTFHTVSFNDCISAAIDQCDGPNVTRRIVGVSSDEPAKANVDVVIADDGASVQLRAEREGSGDGRVYTMFAVVGDDDGNATRVSCKVAVPLDQSGAPAIDSSAAYCVGRCN